MNYAMMDLNRMVVMTELLIVYGLIQSWLVDLMEFGVYSKALFFV
jgi:hypothetical protein